jgi:hypothetical protein
VSWAAHLIFRGRVKYVKEEMHSVDVKLILTL